MLFEHLGFYSFCLLVISLILWQDRRAHRRHARCDTYIAELKKSKALREANRGIQ